MTTKQRTGGYVCNWVEAPPDELKCMICLSVARRPQQHGGKGACGKIFCRSCIEPLLKDSKSCPSCKRRLSLFDDIKSASQIKSLKVKCFNDGCRWTDELRELNYHLDICDFDHVQCKYARVGCKETPLRKDIWAHQGNASTHLEMTSNKVLELSATVKLLQSKARLPFVYQLREFNTHKCDNDELFSEPFYTSPSGYKMCLCVLPNGDEEGRKTHLSLFVSLMRGDNDGSLTWPFTGTVMVKILNQLEDKNHHKRVLTFPADSEVSERVLDGDRETKSGWGSSVFISHRDLDHQPDKNCQYLKDDTVLFRVTAHVPDHRPWLD